MITDNNLNGKVLQPLIDFDMIVDSELGLIRFIRDNFQDPRAFDLDVLNRSDSEILSLLYSRTNINPLSIISTKENMGDIDKLYKSFNETYRKEILKKSIAEGRFLKFIQMMITTGHTIGVSCSICIKDDLEKREITSRFGNVNTISKSDKVSICNKDAFYVRDYSFFTELGIAEKLKLKKIYMPPTTYNSEYFENTKNGLTTRNQLVFIGNDYRIPKGELNNEKQ